MKKSDNIDGLIKKVLTKQRFAVLATQSDGQPYGNLVAFAETGDLRNLLFITGRNTRKYANSLASNKVAVLIDSRTNQATDLKDAIAITALGTVEEVTIDLEERLVEVFLAKHPELKEFLLRPSNALMKVTVNNYIIATFDSVNSISII
jgi:heme iron utilization protein